MKKLDKNPCASPIPYDFSPLNGMRWGMVWYGLGWDYACREELEWSKLELGLLYGGFFAGGLRLADTLEEQVEVSATPKGGRQKRDGETKKPLRNYANRHIRPPPPPRMAGIYAPLPPPQTFILIAK